jgi:hypothetical protein
MRVLLGFAFQITKGASIYYNVGPFMEVSFCAEQLFG